MSEGAGTARPHLSRISAAGKSVVAVGGKATPISRLLSQGPRREIHNRADPREHGAVFSVQHLLVSIRGTHFWARASTRPVRICKRPGGHSKQSILRNRRGPQSANALR